MCENNSFVYCFTTLTVHFQKYTREEEEEPFDIVFSGSVVECVCTWGGVGLAGWFFAYSELHS